MTDSQKIIVAENINEMTKINDNPTQIDIFRVKQRIFMKIIQQSEEAKQEHPNSCHYNCEQHWKKIIEDTFLNKQEKDSNQKRPYRHFH